MEQWERPLAAALGGQVRLVERLARPNPTRSVWAAETDGHGAVVVKARRADRADAKTRWAAEHLPLLAARGYPVPQILWHGEAGGWYVALHQRLPGSSLTRLEPQLLHAILALVELQADAGLDGDVPDFAQYQAHVLFDGWDDFWRDAEAAAPALVARVRALLGPVWGEKLEARDYANNDLNATNILADGARITGVVDWDEFALNTRAADLAALAFDCADDATRDAVLDRIVAVAGEAGLRLVLGYRVIAHVGALEQRRRQRALRNTVENANAVLDAVGRC